MYLPSPPGTAAPASYFPLPGAISSSLTRTASSRRSSEGWWKGSKAFGFKYRKEFTSKRLDRPNEVVLPDPMICLAGANIWAALTAWKTGEYVHVKEFSQELLENTYHSLLAVIEKQRNGPSSKAFNSTMHELYLKASRSSAVSVAASGSANNVISLAIDSD
ncbi:hypothetical protein B0H19DRAFT_1111294 [Mycena capillaripes]|nr:hypothetical protein B0H19DRAFT_1186297 [Mycena capillaripes]KAJ6553249.1 hypothetical protein B0H19DRAFT_1156031 [Mycena capillaripes]KAJ6586089.1 hypothetical protein B0H19DRAFT_1111294 [Mycena capillaripes]